MSEPATPGPHWLILEAYHGGSHRHLIEGLRAHVVADATVLTLPARKWKWRMRGAALEFAPRIDDLENPPDAIFASSMVNLADVRALLAKGRRDVPIVAYFHENQLAYPVQEVDPRDHHFAWTNALTALAADRVLWNSAYNRDSFLDELGRLLRKMPDARPDWILSSIAARSAVLPVPIDDDAFETPRGVRKGPCHIVWNHRWEHDKGPELLLELVRGLIARKREFRLSVVGQRFETRVPAMDAVREAAGDHVDTWGFVERRADYHRLLARADVALSTAHHEFQGLAVLEAAAAGAVPLVPDRLAYPEIWPSAWRATDAEFLDRLDERIVDVDTWRAVDPRPIARSFAWSSLSRAWRAVFAAPPAAPGGSSGPRSTH